MKMCEFCGKNKASVPDRNRSGRPIKRVCSACHSARLCGDLKYIQAVREQNRIDRLNNR